MLVYVNIMTYVSFMDDLRHFGVFSSNVPSVGVNWFCVFHDEHVDFAFFSFLSYFLIYNSMTANLNNTSILSRN